MADSVPFASRADGMLCSIYATRVPRSVIAGRSSVGCVESSRRTTTAGPVRLEDSTHPTNTRRIGVGRSNFKIGRSHGILYLRPFTRAILKFEHPTPELGEERCKKFLTSWKSGFRMVAAGFSGVFLDFSRVSSGFSGESFGFSGDCGGFSVASCRFNGDCGHFRREYCRFSGDSSRFSGLLRQFRGENSASTRV